MTQLSTLNKYFWKYRWLFFLGFFFVILTNYFRILSPQLTGYVVNTVVQSINSKGQAASHDINHANANYDMLVKVVINKFDTVSFFAVVGRHNP